MTGAATDLLLDHLERAYRKKSWHGTNLRGSIRGLAPELAAWRPAPERHNVWELVVHCAYWKYVVGRRFTGERRGSFPLAGSNFFRRPEAGRKPAAADWKRDVALLDEMHRALVGAVAELPARRLDEAPAGSKVSNRELLLGIAAHDLYHAGQIQLLKRLARER